MAYPSAQQLDPILHDTHTGSLIERRPSDDSGSFHKGNVGDLHGGGVVELDKEQQILAAEVAKDEAEVEGDRQRRREVYTRFRPFILGATALLILGWWISATVLSATRHRW